MKSSAIATVLLTLVTAACSGSRSGPAAPSAPVALPQGFGVIARPSGAGCAFNGSSGCFSTNALRPSAVASAAAAPSAPSGLTATAAGSTVTLTWLAPTGTEPATSYVIEAGSAPGLADLANFSTGSTATTFSASGVGSGSYYVRVRAANSSGTSAASNEALLVVGGTTCAAPSAPANLTTVTNSGGTVVLSWTAGSGSPTTYIVEAGSAAGLADLVNSDLGGPTPSLTATGVGNGTYYVRIRARNACGTSAASNEITLVVGTTTAAASVTGTWVGLVANGDGVVGTPDECGVEKFDWQLDLVQTGTSVTGTVSQRTVISLCESTGRLKTAAITGTVSGNTLAFSLVAEGKPALLGTLSFTSSRMTGTMCNGPSCGGSNTIALNKQ